jgi:glycosyltransferase involved in cell wall biosynthesis
MHITIINGFFLPVPPVRGGATEKTWYQLAREFTARGHTVTCVSRCWPGFPDDEIVDGIRHLRLPGHEHTNSRWQNLLHDFLWSRRVLRSLPPADIVVCNAVTLPVWLGRSRPSAGRIVVMCGRMPKGQYRHYRDLSRILAPSALVRDRVLAENPALSQLVRVSGYPINASLLNENPAGISPLIPLRREPGELTVGYVGRINEEKGLRLLAAAIALVCQNTDLPPWRLLLCGPVEIGAGGSGPAFRNQLKTALAGSLGIERLHLLDPQFNERTLAAVYRQIDVFCYPSLAEQGETFGVAVAEAMATGAVPVVSGLACFRDFARDGETALTFDHTAPDAAERLAGVLTRLLRDAALRAKLSSAARIEAKRFDFPIYAETMLADFASLTRS